LVAAKSKANNIDTESLRAADGQDGNEKQEEEAATATMDAKAKAKNLRQESFLFRTKVRH